jgi:type VI secretion system protein ImpA
MPTPATIDIDALLLPIPGDDPAGDPLPGPTREKIKTYREEFDPADLHPDDPLRNDPTVQKKEANWQGVIDLGEETLKSVSKSLLMAVRMTEALTMKHGFPGARDGFRLLRRLSEVCWDRMQPKIEELDDLVNWADTFAWLDDDKGSGAYAIKLKAVPVLVSGSTRISVIAYKGHGRQSAEVTMEQVSALARAADPRQCQAMLDEITETIDEVNRLRNVLEDKMEKRADVFDEKMGTVGDKKRDKLAPSFAKIGESLEECRTLAQGIVQQSAEAGGGASADVEGAAAGPAAGGAATTREGAYRQLEAAANALARVEPHSPVPYLVKRAVQLKNVKFPDLVEQLTKDANVLAFLKRDLEGKE